MLRKFTAVIGSFFIWMAAWIGCEVALGFAWPKWFGAQQIAFQRAIENGEEFSPDTSFLITQLVYGTIVSLMSGLLCALISGERRIAPYVLAVILAALAFLRLIFTWSLVPLWFHLAFTATVIIMPIVGSKLKHFPPARA